MRPNSIVIFERLFFGSLALGILSSVVNWQKQMAMLAVTQGMGQFGVAMVIGSMVFGLGISLLFWYFIARRASNVMRWIWTVLVVIGLPFQVLALTGATRSLMSPLAAGFSVVNSLLGVAGVIMLFRPDARQWFASKGQVIDADVFS